MSIDVIRTNVKTSKRDLIELRSLEGVVFNSRLNSHFSKFSNTVLSSLTFSIDSDPFSDQFKVRIPYANFSLDDGLIVECGLLPSENDYINYFPASSDNKFKEDLHFKPDEFILDAVVLRVLDKSHKKLFSFEGTYAGYNYTYVKDY